MSEEITIDQYGRLIYPYMEKNLQKELRSSGVGFYDPQLNKHVSIPANEKAVNDAIEFSATNNLEFEHEQSGGLSLDKPEKLIDHFRSQRYALSWQDNFDQSFSLPKKYKNDKHKKIAAKLNATLSAWQKAGIFYAMQARQTFLADVDQAESRIVALIALYFLGGYSALLVCSRKNVPEWKKQAASLLPHLDVIEISQTRTAKADEDVLYILAYEDFSKSAKRLSRKRYRSIIVDHANFIKNSNASRTEYVSNLARKQGVIYRFLLTDFPMNLSPKDLLAPLEILGVTDLFEDLITFMQNSPANPTLRNRSYFHNQDYQRNLGKLDERLRWVGLLRRAHFPGLQVVKKTMTVKLGKLPDQLQEIEDVRHPLRQLAFTKALDIATKLKAQQKRCPSEKSVIFAHYLDVANYLATVLGANLLNSANRSKPKNLEVIQKFRTQKGGGTLIVGNKVDKSDWHGDFGHVDTIYVTDPHITPMDYANITQKLAFNENQHPLTIVFLLSNHAYDHNAWAVLQERIKETETVLDHKPA